MCHIRMCHIRPATNTAPIHMYLPLSFGEHESCLIFDKWLNTSVIERHIPCVIISYMSRCCLGPTIHNNAPNISCILWLTHCLCWSPFTIMIMITEKSVWWVYAMHVHKMINFLSPHPPLLTCCIPHSCVLYSIHLLASRKTHIL